MFGAVEQNSKHLTLGDCRNHEKACLFKLLVTFHHISEFFEIVKGWGLILDVGVVIKEVLATKRGRKS
jgi:hypothetical protein